jgi:hypothetical protein
VVEEKPRLRVDFQDSSAVNTKSFRAWFDGLEVTDQFQVNEQFATSSIDVPMGDHIFMVEVRDTTGNRARESVAFRYAAALKGSAAPQGDEPTGGGPSIYGAGGPAPASGGSAPAPYTPPTIVKTGLDLPLNPDTHDVFRDAALGNYKPKGEEGELPQYEIDPDSPDPTDEGPPPVFFGEEISTENDTIVYVIDISCSMISSTDPFVGADGQTHTGNRLDRAKAETIRSIMALSESFKFNVVSYDCITNTWSSELKKASEANKAAASAWVNALKVAGGTGTGPAVVLGLNFGDVMAVAVLTDGEPNCGVDMEGHRQMIRVQNDQGARIDVFGIQATGIYRSFCRSVASENSGTYFDVP